VSKDRGRSAHDAPAERYGYISHERGYVPGPARPANAHGHKPDPAWAANEREQHLHRHYRKRIRGIRMRWLGSGLTLGVLAGIALILVASALVVTQFPSVLQGVTTEPDVAVVIGESFLNREAANKLKQPYSTGIGTLTLQSINIDLKPDNRMDLQPTFAMNVFFTTLQVSPAAKNLLEVQNGKLVSSMVGDPQVGSLNVPLETLPFNLNAQLKQAIDKVSNDLLITPINQSLQSGFGSPQFTIEGVTTSETALTVRMRGKP
jgi:hypothetical protein